MKELKKLIKELSKSQDRIKKMKLNKHLINSIDFRGALLNVDVEQTNNYLTNEIAKETEKMQNLKEEIKSLLDNI